MSSGPAASMMQGLPGMSALQSLPGMSAIQGLMGKGGGAPTPSSLPQPTVHQPGQPVAPITIAPVNMGGPAASGGGAGGLSPQLLLMLQKLSGGHV